MAREDPLHEELNAAISARRELGPAYQDAVVDSFLAQVDRRIDARIDGRLDTAHPPKEGDEGGKSFALALASLGIGVPLTGIAGSLGDLPGLVVAWAGIVGVNAAHAWSRRRSARR